MRPLGNGVRDSQQLREAPEALSALTPSTAPPPTGRREFGLPDALRMRAGGDGTPLEVISCRFRPSSGQLRRCAQSCRIWHTHLSPCCTMVCARIPCDVPELPSCCCNNAVGQYQHNIIASRCFVARR